jgi:predicted anti-sigma-YlaC factor YlaD
MEVMMQSRSNRAAANSAGKALGYRWLATAVACALVLSGCSIKKLAVNKIGNSLANSGTTFSADDDPDLVGDALPFSLKLMESLLAESPKHSGLLFAASSGFTQYAYIWVQQPAEQIEAQDVAKSQELRARARRLYLRGRDYGLRGLEVKHCGFGGLLRENPKAAVRVVTSKSEVPLLYWTAASWGLAIANSKDNPDLIADQPVVEALIDRALALDSDYDHGAIHGFLISYEPSRQGIKGDFAERCRGHFQQQVKLTGGQLASPYVALAEAVSVQKQDQAEFENLLQKALAIDPDRKPEWRLSNIVAQRRARWLLGQESELFLPKDTNSAKAPTELAISLQGKW